MDFLDSRGDPLRVPFNILSVLFAIALIAVGIHAGVTGAYKPCLEDLRAAMTGSFVPGPGRPSPGLAYAGTLLIGAEFALAFALAFVYAQLMTRDPIERPDNVWPLAETRLGRRFVAFLERLERRSMIASNGTAVLMTVTLEELAFRLVPLWLVPTVLAIRSPTWLAALFWTSAVVFAVVHLRKFVRGFRKPYLCLPQFIGGVAHGYVFLTYGFAAAVAYHWIFNAALATWSDSWDEFR